MSGVYPHTSSCAIGLMSSRSMSASSKSKPSQYYKQQEAWSKLSV